MKGSIGIGRSLSITKRTSLILQSSFSTSSSGGRGRGRGGGASPFFQLTRAIDLEESDSDFSKPRNSDESPPIGLGHGRGRGKPISADPITQSFVSSFSQTGSGRGRGQVTPESVPPPPQTPGQPKQPIFIKKNDAKDSDVSAKSPASESVRSSESMFSSQIFSASTSSGAGRGKPLKQPEPTPEEVRQQPPPPQQPPLPQLSMEDAAKKALGILSKGSDREESGTGRGGGRGGGRGRGRGRGMGRERMQRKDVRVEEGADEELPDGRMSGNDAEWEKLAEMMGPENMSKLADSVEEIRSELFPSPVDDAILEALHTNCLIEFEPEYLMGDFESNPDIDDKPPIPLRDALEKIKPFLMAYEGIQSQEEWEEVMEETMKRVPLLQEIVDDYGGPDRITAKVQQEELERVAKTIPESAPSSVKRFANRAVLSLQSNPGWGFDKKCQFMDKLVREVSQQYK